MSVAPPAPAPAHLASHSLSALIKLELERIVQATAGRKHSKLHQECKQLTEMFQVPAAADSGDNLPQVEEAGDAGQLSEPQARMLLAVLRAAMETRAPRAVEVVQDCLQRMVAHGHLRGAADAMKSDASPQPASPQPAHEPADQAEGESGGGEEHAPAAAPPANGAGTGAVAGAPECASPCTAAAQVVELMCMGADMKDEAIELQVLKGILTTASCSSFHVHGEALLRVVTTCYNIFLGSRSEVNQTTAKACLTQMLTVVFQRMEADSTSVQPTPIVVAQVLRPAGGQDISSPMMQFVQTFVNKVLADMEEALYTKPTTTPIHWAVDETATTAGDKEAMDRLEANSAEAISWSGAQVLGGEPGSGEEASQEVANAVRCRDAFLVFRRLCNLSVKEQEGATDPFHVQARGRVLSLELLKVLLDNAGAVFHQRFVGAIKQYLCMSLLKNCSHPTPHSFQISVAIFSTLLVHFRSQLKSEIGVFFPMMMLRVLETGSSLFQARCTVLGSLQLLAADPQLLVDLFVNYDCDFESTNIFERTVTTLVKVAQRGTAGAVSEAVLSPQQEAQVQAEAMQCLVGILRSLARWSDAAEERPQEVKAAAQSAHSLVVEAEPPAQALAQAEEEEAGGGSSIEAMKANKRKHHLEMQEGIALFNTKPSKGIAFLQQQGKVGETAQQVAQFLKANPEGLLDRAMIGEFLGDPKEFHVSVMHAYVDAMDFAGMAFDEAIRHFLAGFRLPGEAQKIDRLMEKFAERFCKTNPRQFKSADTAYVLAYSVIMLNTDAHNPQVKVKMRKDEFLRNNRGIDDGRDLEAAFMEELYDRIVSNEIRMKGGAEGERASVKGAAGSLAAAQFGIDLLRNLLPRRRTEVGSEMSEDAIRSMQKKLRDQDGVDSEFVSVKGSECVRPMLEVIWPPLLACFSLPMEKSEDLARIQMCLDGFQLAIHSTAVHGLLTVRDAFVQSLAKFTLLHDPANMSRKNVDAIKVLVAVALEDGNNLQGAWVHLLKSVSRYDLVCQLAAGVMTDHDIFASSSPHARDARTMSSKLRSKATKAIHRLYSTSSQKTANGSKGALAAGEGKPLAWEGGAGEAASRYSRSSSMDMPIQYADTNNPTVTEEAAMNVGSSISGVGLEEAPPPAGVIELIDPMEVHRMFVHSERLNSEAVVEFVRALCRVSLEELRSDRPRVFALTKIVEIAHFNMSRIRLVWTRIWNVLADYFITVGCHPNLQIAMHAVDSLRQLAMKFLERDELANYQFQNDFLKPFVVVMRQSACMQTRELIIRCVSQMVLVRVSNIKSGWKSMFMVFTTAAADEQRAIVSLAFETVEKIVREHFAHITETETATFTDCVNCLIAFTNSHFNMDISLNAIAFLRFCALKLAEGAIGQLEMPSPASGVQEGAARPAPPSYMAELDHDVHVYFWFPLLAGLSELTFDARPPIRKSALEVLFDILRVHGHIFSEAFWGRVFDSVLLPIFDHVRSGEMFAGDGQDEIDAWLYETCTHCLRFVVDLFAQFYQVVGDVLPQILTLLCGFAKRPHERLAAVGVEALGRLLRDAGPLLKPQDWDLVLASLKEAVGDTLPDVYSLVGPPSAPLPEEQPEQQGADPGEGPLLEQGSRRRSEPQSGEAEARAWGALRRAVQSRSTTQTLLMKLLGEVHATHSARLEGGQLAALLHMLRRVMHHARAANRDHCLRSLIRIASEEMEGKPGMGPSSLDSGLVSDQPLLELERSTAHVYLAILMRAHLQLHSGASRTEGVQDVADVDSQLTQYIEQVLRGYVLMAEQLREGDTAASQEAEALSGAALGSEASTDCTSQKHAQLDFQGPLVTAALQGLLQMAAPTFQEKLPVLFALLTDLIKCQAAPMEVFRKLSAVFADRIGPILEEKLAKGVECQ